ncbi:MAG: hypothetical protein K0U84_20240 [Actinomycetia bacterium]|nr:hypothetical protein [Actinomycetes bacterium]
MTSAAVSPSPITSWWYGQGRAVEVVRRLESLYGLSPAPSAPAGLVTVGPQEVTVTFVGALKTPLPHPWRSADANPNEARIPWDDLDPGVDPDPDRPVYLVAFGVLPEGGLVALNLAAFQRIRIQGDRDTAAALVSRWVLELLATHPTITVGVSADVWSGPHTTRVRLVGAGDVPAVDVLVCGAELSYTDRAQIVSAAGSKIMIDLGADAAVDTKWRINCSAEGLGEISNGVTQPMTAALILPATSTLERCSDLLTQPPPAPTHLGALPAAESLTPDAPTADQGGDPDSFPAGAAPSETAGAPTHDAWLAQDHGIDFFSPSPEAGAPPGPDDAWGPAVPETTEPQHERAGADTEAGQPPVEIPAPAAVPSAPDRPLVLEDSTAPQIARIWNHILGQVDLCPPHSTQPPGPREKRLNELTVFLQTNPWTSTQDITAAVYSGAASDKTVTQQLSLLRARLGVVHAGGPKALPVMRDGGYRLDPGVRSDWMEFERLVEILVETTSTANLVAAMDLVTGAPFGGVSAKEWAWTKDLREEIRDRVAGAAVALAGRQHRGRQFSVAIETARKGLWYDNARQDLWQVGMQAALDGHDNEAFKALRGQYLAAVAGPDRDPAVFELTRQPR